MVKKVLVAIADGIEEIETACIVDVLRRAGADVTVASVGQLQIKASRRMIFVADKLIAECKDYTYDLIVLPGGMPGAEHLRDSADLTEMLKNQAASLRLYAAICASPAIVLATHGLLDDKDATCHPALGEQLKCRRKLEQNVVVDGNCITSRGPGTALEFALELVRQLFDNARVITVAEPMLIAQDP